VLRTDREMTSGSSSFKVLPSNSTTSPQVCLPLLASDEQLIDNLDNSSDLYIYESDSSLNVSLGPSIKYVTLEGRGGVREGVTVCDRGRGSRACEVTLIQIFIIHMKHEI